MSLTPQLVSCSVSSYQHSSVSLEFFETVVRYEKFFLVEPHHIPNVLVSHLVKDDVMKLLFFSCGSLLSLLVLCSLSDGVSGPERTETQQPEGPQQSGVPLLKIRQNFAVSPASSSSCYTHSMFLTVFHSSSRCSREEQAADHQQKWLLFLNSN